MPKVSYMNKTTGKKFTGEAKDVELLKKHPIIGDNFSYELETPKPEEPKSNTTPAETGK